VVLSLKYFPAAPNRQINLAAQNHQQQFSAATT